MSSAVGELVKSLFCLKVYLGNGPERYIPDDQTIHVTKNGVWRKSAKALARERAFRAGLIQSQEAAPLPPLPPELREVFREHASGLPIKIALPNAEEAKSAPLAESTCKLHLCGKHTSSKAKKPKGKKSSPEPDKEVCTCNIPPPSSRTCTCNTTESVSGRSPSSTTNRTKQTKKQRKQAKNEDEDSQTDFDDEKKIKRRRKQVEDEDEDSDTESDDEKKTKRRRKQAEDEDDDSDTESDDEKVTKRRRKQVKNKDKPSQLQSGRSRKTKQHPKQAKHTNQDSQETTAKKVKNNHPESIRYKGYKFVMPTARDTLSTRRQDSKLENAKIEKLTGRGKDPQVQSSKPKKQSKAGGSPISTHETSHRIVELNSEESSSSASVEPVVDVSAASASASDPPRTYLSPFEEHDTADEEEAIGKMIHIFNAIGGNRHKIGRPSSRSISPSKSSLRNASDTESSVTSKRVSWAKPESSLLESARNQSYQLKDRANDPVVNLDDDQVLFHITPSMDNLLKNKGVRLIDLFNLAQQANKNKSKLRESYGQQIGLEWFNTRLHKRKKKPAVVDNGTQTKSSSRNHQSNNGVEDGWGAPARPNSPVSNQRSDDWGQPNNNGVGDGWGAQKNDSWNKTKNNGLEDGWGAPVRPCSPVFGKKNDSWNQPNYNDAGDGWGAPARSNSPSFHQKVDGWNQQNKNGGKGGWGGSNRRSSRQNNDKWKQTKSSNWKRSKSPATHHKSSWDQAGRQKPNRSSRLASNRRDNWHRDRKHYPSSPSSSTVDSSDWEGNGKASRRQAWNYPSSITSDESAEPRQDTRRRASREGSYVRTRQIARDQGRGQWSGRKHATSDKDGYYNRGRGRSPTRRDYLEHGQSHYRKKEEKESSRPVRHSHHHSDGSHRHERRSPIPESSRHSKRSDYYMSGALGDHGKKTRPKFRRNVAFEDRRKSSDDESQHNTPGGDYNW